MTATGHALIGALLAGKIKNPLVLAAAGVGSHFLGDVLPHWDSGTHLDTKTKYRFFIESTGDVLMGAMVSLAVYNTISATQNYTNLAIGVFSAQLPDWISIPTYIFDLHIPVFVQLEKLQGKLNQRLDKPWGIVTQAAAIVALYILLYMVI